MVEHKSFENYAAWEASLPDFVTADALWQFTTYRHALFLADLAWHDCAQLQKDFRGKAIAAQLIRSAGSVAANIEEGYGRGFGKDYGRFLSIALGSARETRGWYFRGRILLPEPVLQHRTTLLNNIIGGLVTATRHHNQHKL